MTGTSLKLKVSPRLIKVGMLPRYPASIVGGAGVNVTANNGELTISLGAGAPLSATSDTNITLTLGGSYATSVLAPTSVSVGWIGTLAAARLNANVVQGVTNDTNITGSIAAQNLTLGWTGTLANNRLATMAAHTIKGNNTASTASPSDLTGDLVEQLLLFTQTGTGASQRALDAKIKEAIITPQDFGAVGDGVTDDTTALQNAINQAQSTGQELFIPPGSYKITTTLNITAHIRIRGAGITSDSGADYESTYVTQTTGWKSPTILPSAGTFSAFHIATNQAVQLSDFQIVYVQANFPAALSGISAITIAATSATNINVGSLFSNLMIYGADRGINLANCVSWIVSKCQFFTCQSFGIFIDSLGGTYTNYGDWYIEGNTFWSGSAHTQYHINILSGGAGKVVGNKFNQGAGSGQTSGAILVSPNTAYSVSVEPLTITGNSLEGCTYGVFFSQSPSGTATLTLANISANQFWCVNPIVVQAQQNTIWVTGLVISGNTIQSQNNSGNPIQLDGVKFCNITGNTLNNQLGGVVSAFLIGSHTSNISHSGNLSDSSVTLNSTSSPAVPASTVAATNGNSCAQSVSIWGGTGTVVAVNGSTVLSQSSGAFNTQISLNPGDTITLTYSAAPSWFWRSLMA